MTTKTVEREKIEIDLPIIDHDFIEETFERVTGAPILGGNNVRLLIDATENRIYFESYIIHEDEQGYLFADALIKKAKEGVEVKLIYDWMGGFGKTSRSYWNRLRENGIEVRCYNPPRLRDPLGVLSRDHRKCLIVDGRVAFVTGLCVGNDWVGNPANNIPPWRDTGVQLNGPAVADVEAAFSEVWATMGTPLDTRRISRRQDIPNAGDHNLLVVQTAPSRN